MVTFNLKNNSLKNLFSSNVSFIVNPQSACFFFFFFENLSKNTVNFVALVTSKNNWKGL